MNNYCHWLLSNCQLMCQHFPKLSDIVKNNHLLFMCTINSGLLNNNKINRALTLLTPCICIIMQLRPELGHTMLLTIFNYTYEASFACKQKETLVVLLCSLAIFYGWQQHRDRTDYFTPCICTWGNHFSRINILKGRSHSQTPPSRRGKRVRGHWSVFLVLHTITLLHMHQYKLCKYRYSHDC